jgi:glutamate racemase
VPMALVSILQVLGEDHSPMVAYICYLFCRYSRLRMDNKIDDFVLVCTHYRVDRSIN